MSSPDLHLFRTTCRLFLLAFLIIPAPAYAHEGHDHAPGEDDGSQTGPIVITKEAEKNLGIKILEAKPRVIGEVISVIGQVEAIPRKSAAISSRVSGRVSSLKVQEGEVVKRGESLIEVESRQLGDPPPRVEYKSPIDGVVIDRHAVLGETVEPDRHLFEVADLTEVYVAGKVYENQIRLVEIGQRARISVESYLGESFEGVVELMSGALDPESHTLKVWIRVSNGLQKLRPNMLSTLYIYIGQSDPVIAIPNEGILGGEGGGYFTFVQSDSNPLEYNKQSVVIGVRDDQYTEIIEGILPGDKVVTSGNYQLQYVKTQKKNKGEQSEGLKSALDKSENKSGISTSLLYAFFGSIFINIFLLVRRRPSK